MVAVVVAPCAFKGTLPAARVAHVVGAALRQRGCDVDECPLPDGGEGTVRALVNGWIEGLGPPRPIRQTTDASVVTDHVRSGRTLLIESASYIGLPRHDRDGSLSSAPLGRVVRHAVDRGVVRVVVALGGTGVVDGGAGFLAEVGDVAHVAFIGLVDVDAPLCGPAGARLYFAQKGVPLDHFDRVEHRLRALHPRFVDVKGAGAAGGMGAAILSLGGLLRSGAQEVADAAGLDVRVGQCDVVVGGEGRVDVQTLQGKSLAAVRAAAKKHGKRFVVVCGSIDDAVGADFADDVVELGDAGLVDPVGALTVAASKLRIVASREGPPGPPKPGGSRAP